MGQFISVFINLVSKSSDSMLSKNECMKVAQCNKTNSSNYSTVHKQRSLLGLFLCAVIFEFLVANNVELHSD